MAAAVLAKLAAQTRRPSGSMPQTARPLLCESISKITPLPSCSTTTSRPGGTQALE